MNIISVKQLRNNLQKYADRTQKGEKFLVIKQSKPIFQVMPVEEVDIKKEKGWKTIIDFTKIKKGGVPAEDVIKALKNLIRRDEQIRKISRSARSNR